LPEPGGVASEQVGSGEPDPSINTQLPLLLTFCVRLLPVSDI